MILDRLVNIFIFVYTVYAVISCFRKPRKMASEPVSLVAMYIGGFLVCVIVRFLYHL